MTPEEEKQSALIKLVLIGGLIFVVAAVMLVVTHGPFPKYTAGDVLADKYTPGLQFKVVSVDSWGGQYYGHMENRILLGARMGGDDYYPQYMIEGQFTK